MLQTQIKEEEIDSKKYFAAQVSAYPAVLERSPRVGVFFTWEECQQTIVAFPYTRIFEFPSLIEAEGWIAEWDGGPDRSQTTETAEAPIDYEPPTTIRSEEGISQEEMEDVRIEVSSGRRKPQETYTEADKLPQNPPHIKLSTQQRQVLERVKHGKNVFFTGSAGTGKSVLLRSIISHFARDKTWRNLGITASTGIAAENIGGRTLHSFAGIGLGKGKVEDLVEAVKNSTFSRMRWIETEVLIIDEISMIDGVLFDKLEYLARCIRNNNKPFGGIQLIISGDFCQLPPVPDRLDGIPVPITFAFEAESWDRCVGLPVILEQVFRQRDSTFVNMLNSMRYGEINEEDEARLRALSREVNYTDGIEPTELYPLRAEVVRANKFRLKDLPNPTHTYIADNLRGLDSKGEPVSFRYMDSVLNKLVAIQEVTLKVGAQVMLIMNLPNYGLVNGSLGRVIGFRTTEQAHKELIKMAIPDDKDKSNGNGVKNIPREQLKASPREWPLVQFTNGREYLCVPMKFEAVGVLGNVEATRNQVPLILAWAMSIHKSQGQTLERVKVDLGRTFEKGQAYVALSRATSLDGLQVVNFDRNKVMAHPRVLEWNRQILMYYEEERNLSFNRDVDSEEAIRAYFELQDLDSK
ncbi:dna repair and recombination pif1 [Pyrrhoderma noxium]|uniref:ATP-dependent DNA helicase PIF1 n=1 Tax=Pyrrhoderma noxium TaxID=2282107 RepID=A0A286UR16_9AGAM|nr:dna repair and recombination pif1 [Pyrrhoderma noxium]